MRVDPPPSRPVLNPPCSLIPWKVDGEERILSGMSETERSLLETKNRRDQKGGAPKTIGTSVGLKATHLVIWINSVPRTKGLLSGKGLSSKKAIASGMEAPQIPILNGHLFRVSCEKSSSQKRPRESS